MNTQPRRGKPPSTNPRHHYVYKAVCLITIWGILACIFFSPASISLESIEDFLINEKWFEPKTQWRPTASQISTVSGRPIMQKTNVTFLGVARNIGPRLPILLQQIEYLAQDFSHSRAIFVEGGSSDNTSDILQKWTGSSVTNRTLIKMPGNDSFEEFGRFKGLKLPREGRLSNARNVGLSELYRLANMGIKTEYVIVVDLDVLGWDPYGVADSFSQTSTWDAVCANGILLHGIYRDTYAFRTEEINTNHHWAGNDQVMYNITAEEKKMYRQRLKVSQSRTRAVTDFTRTGDMLKVLSCFGGLTIYRYATLEGCKYGYRHEQPPFMLDCEHVILHKCMIEKNSARIYSNSKMKLWYGHSPLAVLTFEKVYNHFMG